MGIRTAAPPKGDAKQTAAQPVSLQQLVPEARSLAEQVYLDWAKIRAFEAAWHEANRANTAAAKAILNEKADNDCAGSALTDLIVRCRTNREERDRRRVEFDEANTNLLDFARVYSGHKVALTDMGVRLTALTSESQKHEDAALVARARALAVLVSQIGERAFETDYLLLVEERQKTLPKKPASKKPAPARESFQALFDELVGQLNIAIGVYDKTLAAKKEAKAAVDTVKAFNEAAIVEPLRPTAEEVGRYLFEIDQRARLEIPAQRVAAIAVLKFRRQMLALYDAFKDLGPPLRKVGYLENYQVDAEVEGLIAAAKKISEYFRQIHRDWMRSVDWWSSESLDTSTPVEEQPVEELEIIDLLAAQVKNLGVAVANKSIAGTKFRSMTCSTQQEVPRSPTFSYFNPGKLDDEYDKATKYLTDFAAASAANELAEAKRSMASDAFDARQELARRLSAKLVHTVGVIGSTLKKPMSDQLRVAFFGVRLLHKLNGGYGASAKG